MDRILDVDPRVLYAATSLLSGAVPWKLQQQIIKYGSSVVGMPPIEVEEDSDGNFWILNGMTRATRIAKLSPGVLVPIRVTAVRRKAFDAKTNVRVGKLV